MIEQRTMRWAALVAALLLVQGCGGDTEPATGGGAGGQAAGGSGQGGASPGQGGGAGAGGDSAKAIDEFCKVLDPKRDQMCGKAPSKQPDSCVAEWTCLTALLRPDALQP